jgi:hypothetical protein
MQNLLAYLIIFLGVKLVLILVFGLIIYRERSRIKENRQVSPQKKEVEAFHLVKSSLTKVNDRFLVGQILFSNRRDFTLPTPKETPRHSSDGET